MPSIVDGVHAEAAALPKTTHDMRDSTVRNGSGDHQSMLSQPMSIDLQHRMLAASASPAARARVGDYPVSTESGNVSEVVGSHAELRGGQHSAEHEADGGEDFSHGTLMLSKEGRAKYLGPTAGSEWLKDVGWCCSLTEFRAEKP